MDKKKPRQISALRLLKDCAQRLPTSFDSIVVASFGRAGSTLVYDALVVARAKSRYGSGASIPQRLVRDTVWDLSEKPLRPGVIYKTHDYPEALKKTNGVRAIFLFGSAVDAAQSAYGQKSVHGEVWTREHFQHLRRPYRYDEIPTSDVLGFRDQCIAWMGCEQMPVLCIRYESLWKNVSVISEFCGLDIRLPIQRQRSKKKTGSAKLAQFRATYSALDADMDKLPDCFLADSRHGTSMKLSKEVQK